jgi:zinc D-Ala-D-Ala carboxypeptidase
MLLSRNFCTQEFEKDGPMPDSVVLSYRSLCNDILEPIRAHVGQPLRITSGYRTLQSNTVAGGVSNSQHCATAKYCAADWWVPTADMREIFDWIRLQSGLVWDQLILEHDGGSLSIIHTSWSTTPRRQALEGATANKTGYTTWPVTPLKKET